MYNFSKLVCVTNRHLLKSKDEQEFLDRIDFLAQHHVRAIVLREKDMSEADYEKLARKVIPICEEYGVQCILHSFIGAAKKIGHRAIHLPVPELRNLSSEDREFFKIIGASCHSVEDALEAQAFGCTYIFAGHIFDTDCKKDIPSRGISFLENVIKSVDIPVLAIGGINADNFEKVIDVGASAACIMSGCMRGKLLDLTLYAITDRAWTDRKPLIEQVEDALQGGITCLQLREKNLSEDEFVEEAKEVKKLCDAYDVPLIINDNVDVALKSGAAGVHVGMEDTPVAEIRKRVGENFIIGATAKTVEQANAAYKAGADYLGVGAVFPSSTKKNAIRITPDLLSEICNSVPIPAVAIGGITYENLSELKGCSMDGIATVSAVFGAENIASETKKLKEKIKTVVSK